jgi:hypothetical protein
MTLMTLDEQSFAALPLLFLSEHNAFRDQTQFVFGWCAEI